MRTWLLVLLLLLGACKAGETEQRNGTAAPDGSSEASQASSAGGEKQGAPLRLTGIWEAGSGAQKSQLCMTGEGREAEFGLTVSGPGGALCAGAGKAVRSGERLTLTMSGDRSCEVVAAIKGTAIVLPATAPEGCSYYCAEGAGLAGVSFTRTGSTKADAMKAKDFAGDPLCG